jgi:hypothetical protein
MPQRRGGLLDPRGDEDDLPRRAELDDAGGRFAGKRLAADDVLPLARARVALRLGDLARENDVFDVENADVISIRSLAA